MAEQKAYPGKQAEVHWESRLCIHIGECGRANNDLFVGGRDPWCQPDTVELASVVDVVERCPTGALSYVRKDGTEEQAVGENTVHIANNGPLYLRGDLDIDGAASDMEGVKYRAALCRCGLSGKKPFCDNTHEKENFRDRGAVGDTGTPLEAKGGTLTVKRAPDGPLLVSGNLTIVNAAGRVAWQGTKAALCRCGASKNKPFCDGAHKTVGFKAE